VYKCGWFANGVYLKARTDMGNDDNQIQSVGIGNTPFSDKPISTISTMRSVKGLVLTFACLSKAKVRLSGASPSSVGLGSALGGER
jgi:hypothetical protein